MAEVQARNLAHLNQVDLEVTDDFLVRDSSVTSGLQAKRIAISELDARWQTTTAFIQDVAGLLLQGGTLNGLTIAYNNATNEITITVTPELPTGASASQYLRRNAANTGYEWAAVPSGATTFESLTDTPTDLSGHANQYVRVNAAGNALEFVNVAGTAADTFVGLTDTPVNFAGASNDFVKVNNAGNALEFTDAQIIDWNA